MAALDDAKELLDNFWKREPIQVWSDEHGTYVTDVQGDALARSAELMPVIAYLLIALVEKGHSNG